MDVLGFHLVINDNSRLNATWSEFETPIYQYTTIDSDGYGKGSHFNQPASRVAHCCDANETWQIYLYAELNAVELRPPRMDNSGRTKYPVLFRVYATFPELP
jgi:dipeptidyl aminopeptidase B